MSLILCPECNSKISDKATCCPHCGYIPENKSLPISKQVNYAPTPKFKYEIKEWSPLSNNPITLESIEDNKKLVNFFGNMNNIKHYMPAIAEVIESLIKRDDVLVAKIPEYIQKLIADGTYHFSIDKSGEILPTIRDAKGIVKQVRLENMQFQDPDLIHSLGNLSTQIMMTEILSEIKNVGESIINLQIEIQNDRLALADSAMQSLQQAFLIEDASLRSIAILNCIQRATQAKCTLIRNFENNYRILKKAQKQGVFEGVFKKDNSSKASTDAMNDLISITNSLQIECMGYGALNEMESGRKCLSQFKDFVKVNKLDNRSTLLLINEGLSNKENDVIDQLATITNKISKFESVDLLEAKEKGLSLLEEK